MLLLMLVAIPLIGALILVLVRNKSINIPLITSFTVLLLGSFGLKQVFGGVPLNYSIKMAGPLVLSFQADALSAIFVILSAFLWLVVSIYAPKYMDHEGRVWNFNFWTLLTLFAVMGIFLAEDLLTMLLFFELMTLSSYFWVIHRWDRGAISAGYFYLFFSIVGGLLIALGIAMMGSATDSLPKIASGIVRPLDPKLFAWAIGIFVAGFGIKAGMVPLHLWLPYAHSVAPTPGSGLLSGLIIKVGAYGLIRTGQFAGWEVNLGAGVTWLGPGLIVLGSFTMILGVLAALIQSDGKKLLAYHSISQMGYIILGLGIALYLGSDGGFGLLGAIYHIINHALFKLALFLGLGLIYIYTGERDLYKLGGLWRRFPLTAILMLVAVLGITGAPGLNGYASKSLLHHGVSLAAEIQGGWMIWIEGLFLVVGVGTAASFSKLYYLIFFGKRSKVEIKDKKMPSLQIAMGLLAIVIVVIGIRPELLLKLAIGPAVQALGMTSISKALADFSFWNLGDILEMIITLGLGILVCWAGFKTRAFHLSLPTWLTIEGIVKLVYRKTSVILQIALEYYRASSRTIHNISQKTISKFHSNLRKFDQSKTTTVFGINLTGISADVAILTLVLGLLLAGYAIINPSLGNIFN